MFLSKNIVALILDINETVAVSLGACFWRDSFNRQNRSNVENGALGNCRIFRAIPPQNGEQTPLLPRLDSDYPYT